MATNLRDLAALEGDWRDLEASRPRFIFQRFELARAFAEAYAEAVTPLVVMVEDGGDRALIALGRRRDGRVGALGLRSLGYVDPIATSPAVLGRLADATLEVMAGADLDVTGVRGDSPYLPFWRRLLAPAREPSALAAAGFSHAVVLRPGIARFVSSTDRTRRLIRSLETRFPVEHRTVEAGERDAALDWILEGPPPKTTRGPRSVRRPVDGRHAAFVRSLVAALAPEHVTIRSLHVRDEPIAMLLGLEYRRIHCAYLMRLSGELVRYSPGMACLYRAIAWATDRGLAELDLMRGDEAFKARWADVRRPLLRVMRGRPAVSAAAGPDARGAAAGA